MVAKGSGLEAEIIVNKAKKEGIEIIKDPSTAELLGKADMYDGIPEEAYRLVTEILLYVYKLEKEGNPFSKMMLIGVSSVDRLSDCYVYYGLWASESKIEEMIADYKGRIYEYYEFKEEVINKIRQLYT